MDKTGLEITRGPQFRDPGGSASALRAGLVLLGISVVLLILGILSTLRPAPSAPHGDVIDAPSIGAVGPFAGLLLCIAVFPLIPRVAHWWEHNRNKLLLSAVFAAATLADYLISFGTGKVADVLQHSVLDEYIPFITLLLALYVISGGIALTGDLAAHPTTNTAFLAVGSLLASFVGTTGASILLIRPLLQTNAERKYKTHTVIFFIFLVSNIGGSLLPIGDPPLFLGYLKGVPFLWTLSLWPMWLVSMTALLVLYFVWDSRVYRKEAPRDIFWDETQRTPLSLSGQLNLLWLLGVILCAGLVQPGRPFPLLGFEVFPHLREILMLALAALSLGLTPPQAREANQFNYHAIIEVAVLFVGIFICMQAPIEILRAAERLGYVLNSPARFFWATGVLSSFLDNAPTYAIFLETASKVTPATAPNAIGLLSGGRVAPDLLTAISLGAVFMGASTYIGNGPNFMVKSVAEQSGVRMPSFFGYMLYSAGILLPLFGFVTVLFLR